jgi:ADP-ribose pyrophosphatase
MMKKRTAIVDKDSLYIFNDSSCLLFLNPKDESFVLVRQFRSAHNRYTLELPGGNVENDESNETAACRELFEEAGIKATNPIHIFSLDLDLSTSIHRTHVFLSIDKNDTKQSSQGDFKIVRYNLTTAIDLIEHGDITHAPTVATIYWLNKNIENFK